MKKIFLAVVLAGTLANALELEYLTGDTRLACEAMLCLASPTKPSECSPSLKRYFSISYKKWGDTVRARKNFLNLCPVDSSDNEMLKYKNQILANLDDECSIETLNNRIEKKLLRVERVCQNQYDQDSCKNVEIYGYRVNPNLTNSCALLSSSAYTDYKLKYTCSNEFYEEKDWLSGFVELNGAKQEINKRCWVNR